MLCYIADLVPIHVSGQFLFDDHLSPPVDTNQMVVFDQGSDPNMPFKQIQVYRNYSTKIDFGRSIFVLQILAPMEISRKWWKIINICFCSKALFEQDSNFDYPP